MRLLLDEMYSRRLAEALRAEGTDAATVNELGLLGASDVAVFAAAVGTERAVLTENVADFARLAAEHNAAGGHHSGLLIALSSSFSRRPAGTKPLTVAIQALAHERLDNRVVYLGRARPVGAEGI